MPGLDNDEHSVAAVGFPVTSGDMLLSQMGSGTPRLRRGTESTAAGREAIQDARRQANHQDAATGGGAGQPFCSGSKIKVNSLKKRLYGQYQETVHSGVAAVLAWSADLHHRDGAPVRPLLATTARECWSLRTSQHVHGIYHTGGVQETCSNSYWPPQCVHHTGGVEIANKHCSFAAAAIVE